MEQIILICLQNREIELCTEEYLLIEAYKDGTDVAHVQADHFQAACEMFP
jgi:quinol monooxygenase YgiN